MNLCSVLGCDKLGRYRSGLCDKHQWRFLKYGDPHTVMRTPNGMPHRGAGGYVRQFDGKKRRFQHVLNAEAALGRRLPAGAKVHHVDRDRSHNNNHNLVICPNESYHKLIHRRTAALDACGNADWLKCKFCKSHDAPEKVVDHPSSGFYHSACAAKYQRDRKAA